jgi:Arc/MetJ-type ribon-helix-helix transcriptional regulator
VTLKIEIPEQMSQLLADQVRKGEFKSPEALATAVLARYLDEKAEAAHTQILIDEADASGPDIELTEDEMKTIVAEARAEWEPLDAHVGSK